MVYFPRQSVERSPNNQGGAQGGGGSGGKQNSGRHQATHTHTRPKASAFPASKRRGSAEATQAPGWLGGAKLWLADKLPNWLRKELISRFLGFFAPGRSIPVKLVEALMAGDESGALGIEKAPLISFQKLKTILQINFINS